MRKLQITDRAASRIKAGQRLLQSYDFDQPAAAMGQAEGKLVQLHDSHHQFVAKALMGQQNKGLGWVFTLDPDIQFDHDFIDNIIEDAIQARAGLFEDQTTTAFRLYNGEGDGLGGMTIDYYQDYLLITWYTRAFYSQRDWVLQVLTHYLPQTLGVYETKRFELEEGEKAMALLYGQEAPQPLLVKENNQVMAVYLGQDWMTGVFLDQREVRAFIRSQAAGSKVLNLFSYTGAFSVAAALGGATATVSVDVATRSLERTAEQFAVNGLSAPSDQHQIRVMDVFDYIQYAKRHELTYDWVICDPPSFARTKDYLFRADKDYQALASDLLSLTGPGGFCVLSTNHAGIDKDSFKDQIQAAADALPGHYYFMQSFKLGTDFPTSKDPMSQYLKVLVYYRAQ